MNKHLLLVGDLGAGANLVKNICLLDRSLKCPWQDRYEFFKSVYAKTTFNSWLTLEYKTRFWNQIYGFDLSDDLTFHDLSGLERTVFINHSAFWEFENLRKFEPYCDIVFLTPLSEEGIRWQIRAYVEKKGVEKLHNFSFENPEVELPQYVETHGQIEYQKFNVMNMYEICKRRRDDMLKEGIRVFDMSAAYRGENKITEFFNTAVNLNIPQEQSTDIFTQWHKLHWNFKDTDKWEWGEKYNGYNS